MRSPPMARHLPPPGAGPRFGIPPDVAIGRAQGWGAIERGRVSALEFGHRGNRQLPRNECVRAKSGTGICTVLLICAQSIPMPCSSRPTSDVRIRCGAHGLAYDPSRSNGCVLCRRSLARPARSSSSTRVCFVILFAACGLVLAIWLRLERSSHSDPRASPAPLASGTLSGGALPPPARVLLPSGQAPERGWPVLVGLHGYGSSGERFTAFGSWFPRYGIAALLPTGSNKLSDGRYSWAGPGATLERLHQELATASANYPVDPSCPTLAGFSQGAAMAASTAWLRPASYCGVLAISPVGPLPAGQPPQSSHALPLVVMVGRKDGSSQEAARALAEAWRRAGWTANVLEHPGGHEAPADFAEQIATVLSLLNLPSTQAR
jgi:predicted esterase